MRRGHIFRSGDCVIFRKERRDTHLDLGARDVRPEPRGEGYLFVVDEFWRVSELQAGQLLLLAQRGKTRLAEANDPHLHIASWWEHLIYRRRFPKPEASNSQGTLLS